MVDSRSRLRIANPGKVVPGEKDRLSIRAPKIVSALNLVFVLMRGVAVSGELRPDS
jgi:hypothetical protein